MIIPVVLAGGSGTRLWPMSRKLYPKQMLNLTGEHTMIQNTLLRLAGFEKMTQPVIIGNENQRFLMDQQLAAINIRPCEIFLEPVGRNTAPAVAVAALKAVATDPESLILVLPADHLIADIVKFHDALRTAERFAEQGFLVTFGIVPDRPETGYGYIRQGMPAKISDDDAAHSRNTAYTIREFVEKPDLETARQYLATGEYCWNSGMFMFKAATAIEELRRYVPEIVTACEQSISRGQSEHGCFYLDHEAFAKSPSDSIDYALMEQTDRGIMVPLDAGWDDLGSWEAMWNVGEKDESGNVVSGDVVCVDVKNSLIKARSRLVTVLGLQNIAVVETPDALLVTLLSNTQGVKKIVDILKAGHRKETRIHPTVLYAWGEIETTASGADFWVRKITMRPRALVHTAGHQAGAVTWTIIQGSARVTMDGKILELSAQARQCFLPAAGRAVKLENTGQNPLVFIEVVSGSHTGTDHFELN